MKFFARVFTLLVFWTVFLGQGLSHEISPSIATLQFDQQRNFKLSIETNLEALLADIGSEHTDTDDAPTADLYRSLRALSAADLKAKFDAFSPQLLQQLGLTFNDSKAQTVLDTVQIPEVGDVDLVRKSVVVLSGSVPAGAETLQWAWPQDFGASVLRIERPDQERQSQFFPAGQSSEVIKIGVAEAQTTWKKVWTYIVVGFTHILPKGLDHILFVLGLFLLSTHWKPLLAQVTAFTIAHSVTLALGLYGVISIAPSIVEPLIALSIVYVAVENLFTRHLQVWRPVIVFLFGLLHGLGFAGILTDIGLARSDFVLGLISFNVGVEIGQIAVIVMAFMAVGWFMNRSWYHSRIVVPASLAIAAMGAWWFVERTFL